MDETRRIEVKDGTVLTFDVVKWHPPGWEFDHACAVLSPVVVYSPNGDEPDQMLENVCESAVVNGHLGDDPEVRETGLVARTFPLARLRRRFAEARRGVEFPVMEYEAERFRVRFFTDPQDPQYLAWKVEND